MTANDYMHMCRDFQTAFKTCITLSTYRKLLGGKKQNLQVSIPKTSAILLAWVCVPAAKLDVAWVGKEVKSMNNFHTGSACEVIMWNTIYEKPLQENQLLLIIIYLQDVVASKENGEGNGAMLPHKPCKSTFFEAKKVLFSKAIISRLFW
jgi:hypothetical protein